MAEVRRVLVMAQSMPNTKAMVAEILNHVEAVYAFSNTIARGDLYFI